MLRASRALPPASSTHATTPAIDLDQQRRLDVHRQDARGHVVECPQHRLVDELAGHEPGYLEHHALGARAALLEQREARNHYGQPLGHGQQPHERRGDDGERAFAAGHERAQVDGVGVLEPRDRPVAEDDLDPEHVVGRDAVAEAVQAAGVRADVAADHGRRPRGRVGCEA